MKWFSIAWLGFLSCSAMTQAQDSDLFTNTYDVRPDFIEKIQEADAAPINVTKHFENQGIPFPPNGVALYYPSTSQLVVRNNEEEIELASEFVELINNKIDKQVYITVKEVTVTGEAGEALGFDWMLVMDDKADSQEDSVEKGVMLDSRERFLQEFSRPPTLPQEQKVDGKRGHQGIVGVFTDPQFQVVIRALSKRKGVDVLSAPSVMTRSDQPALIQVGEKRWGIIPIIGADGYTIDLELFLPSHGKALYEEGEFPLPSATLTIWDGQSVAWSEKIDDKTSRTVFIKAQLMDPAGQPINEASTVPPKPAPHDPTIEDLQGSNHNYEVKEGDTLAGIARQFGTSVKRISDANFLSSNVIEVGQKLTVPMP